MPKCNDHTDLVAGRLSLLERVAFLYIYRYMKLLEINQIHTHIKKDMHVFEHKFNIKWSCEIEKNIYKYTFTTVLN